MFAIWSGLRIAHLLRNALRAIIDNTAAINKDEETIVDEKMSVPILEKLHLTSKEKRRSSPGSSIGKITPKHTPKNSPRIGPVASAKLGIDYESPPLVFYGSPASSTGAILSGQLELIVQETETVLNEFDMELVGKVVTKKPVSKDCPDCTTKTTEIKKWFFLKKPVRFQQGKYSFPFSCLIPGHLPATSHSVLGHIEYELRAHAKTSLSETIPFTRILTIERALQPAPERTCTRLFPPTNIISTITLPPTIHPIGEFSLQIRLSGIVNKPTVPHVQQRWRVRKLTWRISENALIISPACTKHAHKLGRPAVSPTSDNETKGLLHQSSRDIGHGEIKRGWKTDFSANQTEIVVPFSISTSAHPVCGVKSPTGYDVSHLLVIELVIAEEQQLLSAGNKNPHPHPQRSGNADTVSPTGMARVLRMQFGVMLTERAGMGISWDEEQPPMYGDVPVSPPGYATVEECARDPISYEELDQMGGG